MRILYLLGWIFIFCDPGGSRTIYFVFQMLKHDGLKHESVVLSALSRWPWLSVAVATPVRFLTTPVRFLSHPRKVLGHPSKLLRHPRKVLGHPRKVFSRGGSKHGLMLVAQNLTGVAQNLTGVDTRGTSLRASPITFLYVRVFIMSPGGRGTRMGSL